MAKWGLVNRVYPLPDLVPTALQLATEMTSTNPDLLRKYKALIDDGFGMTFATAMKKLTLDRPLEVGHGLGGGRGANR